uniref:Ig-like domain-containing protein n=1 Tax=Nothobranchius furzeri TaxID=105023 RepID=A0A8C6LXW6_NOTFU
MIKFKSIWGLVPFYWTELLDGYCVTLNDGVVTAEAGLCAVIPCSFKSAFTSSKIIWYKCEALKCEDSDGVFASKESEGRVSLLESAISKKNCSIRINNLIASDSGSYQLRVEGCGPGEKYTYTVAKTNLSLTGLKQKPTLVVPPLTEGQQTTLTCTAPGLCSGSPPNITWRNITGFHTENLTDFTQRHSSTLTFHPSAEHHDTSITCKISFTGDTTTEETLILNVTCEHNQLYVYLSNYICFYVLTCVSKQTLTLSVPLMSFTPIVSCRKTGNPPSQMRGKSSNSCFY